MKYVQHITIWTITFNPRDFPGLYVVRPHLVGAGWTIPAISCETFKTLEAARQYVPRGSEYMERHPNDDAVIVENWIEWYPKDERPMVQ